MMAVLQIHRLPGVKENPTQSPARQTECWPLRREEGSLTRGKYPALRADAEGPSPCPRSLLHTASQLIRVMSCHTNLLSSLFPGILDEVCVQRQARLTPRQLALSKCAFPSIPPKQALSVSFPGAPISLTCSGKK